MAFKSLAQPRKRLADQVYEQIMTAIHNGDITPDDRIVQEKLAEDFCISRTPVREALFRLEQEGILTVARRGGFRIRQFGQDEIRELYEGRCAVEAFAARMLAQRNDKEINDQLRQTIAAAENLTEETVEAYYNANRAIHKAIVEASANRYLLEFFENIWNRSSSLAIFSTIRDTDLSASLGDHMSLVDAIESGNDSFAAEKMITHITDGYRLQIKDG